MNRTCLVLAMLAASVLPALDSQATVVRYDTVMGSFDVRLFDIATPLTVDNLLNYVNDGDYVDSFIHRSLSEFVIQGGGFTFESNEVGLENVPTDSPVLNEPGISNIRNSISMAKLGGDPDSATSQWFFSVNHNSENLDNQNGGFTVFGLVLGDGMAVIDAIVDLPTIPAGGAFNDLPVDDYPGGTILKDHLVIINSVSVLEVPDGDFDLDGNVDGADLAIWEEDYGRLEIIGGDFNDDMEIDGADLNVWETGYGQLGASVDYTDGDTNGDGAVDGIDFLAWQQGFGGTVDVAADGDGSAEINGRDFLLWQQGFGASPLSSINSVPEPATLLLFCLAALVRPRLARIMNRR